MPAVKQIVRPGSGLGSPLRRGLRGGYPRTLRLVSALLSLTSVVKAQTNSFPEFRVENAREDLGSVSQALWAEIGTNAQTCFIQARLQSQLGPKNPAQPL